MPETADRQEGPSEGEGASPGVGRFLYRLALAGVGGLVLAQEEIAGVLRGREDEGSGESADEPTERDAPAPAVTHVDATIDRVLRSLNAPTRADVDEVARRIDELAAKVEALGDRRG